MAVKANGFAPYAPSASVTALIDRYREAGLATPFTNEVLVRAGISETVAIRVLAALKALDLVTEDGNPTDAMVGLKRASTEEFPQRMAAVVRAAYADVFQYVANPSSADAGRIQDAFRGYTPEAQRKRMVMFFLGICRYAGILEGGSPRLPRRQKEGAAKPSSATRTVGSKPPAPTRRHSGESDASIPATIFGVLRGLPAPGQSWTKEKRDKFMNLFGGAVDFEYPIAERDASVDSDQEDDGGGEDNDQ